MRRLLSAAFLAPLSAVFIFLCLGSLVWTYGPIVKVETTYQAKRLLSTVFGTQSLQQLLLPQLKFSFASSRKSQFSMEIPKLFLNEPIVFNVDPSNKDAYTVALKQGIAQAAGTDLPGQEGLGYYFAHSSEPDFVSQFNAVFYLLGKLETNDQITLWYHDDHYSYRVYDRKVTDPSDVSFLTAHYDRPTIVLQTCWPPGTSQKRLLIFAERE